MSSRALAPAFLIAAAFAALSLTAGLGEAPEEAVLESTGLAGMWVDLEGGSTSAPESVTLRSEDAGLPPLATLRLRYEGLSPRVTATVAGPDDKTYEVRGTILVLGDVSASNFKIHVTNGSAEQLSMRVTRSATSPVAKIWINGTSEKPSFTIEPAVRQQHNPDGSLRALAVESPDGSGAEVARVERTATGYRVSTQHGSEEIAADRVTVDETSQGHLVVRVRDSSGNVVQTLTIDRRAQPATVTLAGEVSEQVSGPVSLEGDPLNPTRLTLYDYAGAPIVNYETIGGKARLDMGGETLLEDLTLLRIDGDPFAESFRLILRDGHGGEHELIVDRDILLAAAPKAAILLSPLESVGGAPEARLLSVRDGANTILGASDLDGRRYLQRAGAHTILIDTNASASWFETVRLQVSSNGTSASAAFSPAGKYQERQTWTATYSPGVAEDGKTVTLDVHLERRLAPMAVQRYTLGASYSYKVDGTPPTVAFAPAASATNYTFNLSWSGADALTGVSGYDIDVMRPGESQWTRWLDGTKATNATFSGDWGKTYQFRARSLDGVRNPSAWKEAPVAVGAQPASADDVNDPPTVQLLSPQSGDLLSGLVHVSWDASDPDGTSVTVTAQVSRDGGATWRTLYSGTDARVLWNTELEPNADGYRVRVTASDGTLSAVDSSGAFAILNVVERSGTAPSGGSGNGGQSGGGSNNGGTTSPGNGGTGGSGNLGENPAPPSASQPSPEAEKGTPGPGLLAGLAALGAVSMLRRRRD